jgi:3',5'-cyclic AMP phosphodiesterase CpdA
MVMRRDFLKASGFVIAGFALKVPFSRADGTESKAKLRFGIMTDAHFADREAAGSRHYRASVDKMAECVSLMNETKVAFLVELGDFKDQGNPASEASTLKYLETIENVFKQFKGPRYHVLGNHDVDSISKEQFLAHVENTGIARESTYYSFDSNGLHFVVLDANYNADGSAHERGNFNWIDVNIPRQQLDWLKNDLASTPKPVIVFIHQQLDGKGQHTVKNAAQVRQILQGNQRVLAVFQGHNHAGHYSYLEGIHYYTLKGMVVGAGEDNNSYAIVDVYDDHSIVVTGYRRATSKKMAKA